MVEPGYPAPGRTAASEGGFGPSDALRHIRLASLALVAIALFGTSGYMLLLGWPFLDALYMTVISMTTVGYKEVHDLSSDPVGQLWTMLILLTGVGTREQVGRLEALMRDEELTAEDPRNPPKSRLLHTV